MAEVKKVEVKKSMSTMASEKAPKRDYVAEEKGAHDEAYKKLSDLLNSRQDLDYDKLFSPYLEKQGSGPMQREVGAGEAFFRGASPQGFKSVMKDIDSRKSQERSRFEQLMETERDIVNAKVNQEMEKGKSAQALKTFQIQKELESKLAGIKEQRQKETWEEKQTTLFGLKAGLEEKKSGLAAQLIDKKARAIADSFHFDEKMRLEFMQQANKIVLAKLEANFSRNMLTGERDISDTDMDRLEADAQSQLLELAQTLRAQQPPEPTGPAPAPSSVTPAVAPSKSRARAAAERIQASRGK